MRTIPALLASLLAAACGGGSGEDCALRVTTTVVTIDVDGDGDVELRTTTTWFYFADGRAQKRVEQREQDAAGGGQFDPIDMTTTEWSYDGGTVASGAVVFHEDLQGLVIRIEQVYTYDAAGRIVSVIEEGDRAPPDGVVDARATEERSYDDASGYLTLRIRMVDHDLDNVSDGEWTDAQEHDPGTSLLRLRSVTAKDYVPLVPDGLPPTYRATVTPRYGPDSRLLGSSTEIDVDLDGLPDSFRVTEHVYEVVCP